ncbi:hypothetical protein VHUM_03703 [Vanrija humicola]|uniref:SART-1 protein n=1 Tax=Vanrija humicola TaxID=5417 RepID=A0A7D8YWL8_VANHU|nr:hypothetical protein VHUM_03703 [Vanrija humicola]
MSVNQETLTLEETNKVRISLGLKPIGADDDAGGSGEVEPTKDEIAEANFAQRRAEERAAKKEKETREQIERVKNQRALNKKLQGSTLGDTSKDDKLSASSWIKAQKKRASRHEKDLAAKRLREMEEADRVAYDESDLAGIKVAHDADAFEEGQDVILTLKDSRILEGDEDELQNVNIADLEADAALKERKRKAAQAYTGYDDDEFEEGRIGQKADVLSKYDEDYSSTGKVKSEGFRLGAPIEKKAKVEEEDVEMFGAAPQSKVKLDLNFARDFDVSDYMKEGDKGFKVKKRRAKKSSRRAEADDGDEMDVDFVPTFTKRAVGDGPDNLVDDDDLQAALARTRREAAKKKPKVKAEDLAARIAEQKKEDAAAEAAQADQNGDDDGRITFDDTSEFVRNVTTASLAAPVKQERTRTSSPAGPSAAAAAEQPVVVKIERVEDGDEPMSDDDDDDEDDALAEIAAREGLSLEEYRQRIDKQMRELEEVKAENAAEEEPEAPVGNGVANILTMLRNQGSLAKRSAQDEERERQQKQHDLWLADHRRRQAQKEMERIAARGGNKDQAQREYDNRMREQQEARSALDAFKNYKPDIKIAYHDEFGREMTAKEAWKSLSHKFHGKTSGRMKTEKRLRKMEEERKAQSMSASDTPLGMTNAFSRRQQKTGEAHMVLSVGNKQSVQMDAKAKRR